MRFYFIRHGESEANLLREFSNDTGKHPLTARGRQQALDCAAQLRGAGLRRIFTSPVLRAVQTSEILGAELNVPVEVAPALREYNVGSFEGSRAEEDWRAFFGLMEDWLHGRRRDQAVGGGESFNQLRARFVPFIQELLQTWQAREGGLALVGHGGTYRVMLPLVLANLSYERILDLPMPNTLQIIAEPRAGELVCVQWGDLRLEEKK